MAQLARQGQQQTDQDREPCDGVGQRRPKPRGSGADRAAARIATTLSTKATGSASSMPSITARPSMVGVYPSGSSR